MEKITEIIRQIPLFSELTSSQLSQVCQVAVAKDYKAREIIFSEGDEGLGFYVVFEGRVKVYKLSPEGKEKILHLFGPGNPFGEVPVFSGDNFPAHSQMITAGKLLFFPRKAILNLIGTNPTLALHMLAVLSRRLREFAHQIENLSLKEVPARLASYLLFLSQEQKNRDLITLTMSKGQLASIIGTIPETLSRIFAKLSGMGLIEVAGSEIQILDAEGLANLAETGKREG